MQTLEKLIQISLDKKQESSGLLNARIEGETMEQKNERLDKVAELQKQWSAIQYTIQTFLAA